MAIHAGMKGEALEVSLEVRADGQVLIDGKRVGWVINYSVESMSTHPGTDRAHWHEIELKFMVDECEPAVVHPEMARDDAEMLAEITADLLAEPELARPYNNNLRRTSKRLGFALAALKRELGT